MTDKIQCSTMVSGEGSWGAFHPHNCKKPAIVEREGKWYCKIHDPEYIKAKSAEKTAKWNAEREARYNQYDLEDERNRITAGLSLADLQALKPERVKASNELYEALKNLVSYYDNWQKVHHQYLSEAHDILDRLDGLKV